MKTTPLNVKQISLLLRVCLAGGLKGIEPTDPLEIKQMYDCAQELYRRGLLEYIDCMNDDLKISQNGSRLIDLIKAVTSVR